MNTPYSKKSLSCNKLVSQQGETIKAVRFPTEFYTSTSLGHLVVCVPVFFEQLNKGGSPAKFVVSCFGKLSSFTCNFSMFCSNCRDYSSVFKMTKNFFSNMR